MTKEKVAVICKYKPCSKESFITKSAMSYGRGKYCSKDCRWKACRTQTTCATCKKAFTSKVSFIPKYCSPKCKELGGHAHKICPICKNEFVTKKSSPTVYCSYKCRSLSPEVRKSASNARQSEQYKAKASKRLSDRWKDAGGRKKLMGIKK